MHSITQPNAYALAKDGVYLTFHSYRDMLTSMLFSLEPNSVTHQAIACSATDRMHVAGYSEGQTGSLGEVCVFFLLTSPYANWSVMGPI